MSRAQSDGSPPPFPMAEHGPFVAGVPPFTSDNGGGVGSRSNPHLVALPPPPPLSTH